MVNRNEAMMINENDSICFAEQWKREPSWIYVHHRYEKLPDDVLEFIKKIKGVIFVFTNYRYKTHVIISECFLDDVNNIMLVICNKIKERWEKDKW